VKQSTGVRQTMEERITAFAQGDMATVRRLWADDPALTMIGTDPGEYSRGIVDVVQVWRSPADGELPIKLTLDELNAYEHGDVGWADGKGRFVADDASVEVRLTAVFTRDGDQWKMIQGHVSIGVPNDRMFDPVLQPAATTQRTAGTGTPQR
jgi:ketosteroid isomerase-like protein